MNRFILLIGILLVVEFVEAQQALLWRLEKKGCPISYLMGTIHYLDRSTASFGDTVLACLKQTNVVALEVNPDDLNHISIDKLFMEHHRLSDLLSANDYSRLQQQIKENTGLELKMFERLKPAYVLSLILKKTDSPNSVEELLQSWAIRYRKGILGLESVKEQLQSVDKIPLEQQVDMLSDLLNDSLKDESMDSLLQFYREEDIEKLAQISSLNPEVSKPLLDKRNKIISRRIAALAKRESIFFAVGAGHLGGKEGVLKQLNKKGYTTEAISIY